MTVLEKTDLVALNKEIEFVIQMGKFNPPLCCVKILNKTLYARRTAGPTYVIVAEQLK